MNTERFTSLCQQLWARINGTFGDLSADRMRTVVSRRALINGKARLRTAMARKNSARQMKEFIHRNRNWNI